MSDANKSSAPRQGRSPSYPSIPLATALEKAQAQYDAEGKYPAPLTSAFKSWGYSPKSSGGREVRASMRYFGLITVEGEGDLAKIRLTEDALRVLTDKREDQSERNALVQRLALTPAAHKKLWTKFPDGIRSEATVAHYLVWEEGFNESAAAALIEQFKETASFARLFEPDSVRVIEADEPELNDQDEGAPDTSVQTPVMAAQTGPVTQVTVMQGERVAFIEESQPGQYLKLIAHGEVDDLMLEALEDYVKRQRKRLAVPSNGPSSPN